MADEDFSTKTSYLDRFRSAQHIRVNWNGILSTDVDRFVSGHAAILSCAKELLLCPLLSAVASCMGPNTVIDVNSHWQEIPVLWTVVAARRGERKTTVFRKVKNENSKLEQEIGALNSVNSDQSVPRLIIDEQNIKRLLQSDEDMSSDHHSAISSVYVILDDFGSWFTRKEFEAEIKPVVLRRLYDGPDLPATNQSYQKHNNKYITFSANAQALDLSALFDREDTEGLLERTLFLCAPDWYPSTEKSEEATHNSPSIQSVLSSVRNLHQVQNITYTFSPDGQTELQKCFDDLHNIKGRFADHEKCRGSVNFASGHVVRLCAVLTALKNGLAMVNRGSFLPPRIIDQDTVRNAYSLVRVIIQQKIALLLGPPKEEHDSNRSIHSRQSELTAMADEEFESTDSKNFKVTTSCIENEGMDTKDVIEIEDKEEDYDNDDYIPRTATVSKIDLSNVPSSSLDFQISDIRSEPYVPSSNDIMILRDGYTTSYAAPRPHNLTTPSGGPVFPDQQMDVGQISNLISGNSSLATATSAYSQQNFDNQTPVPVSIPNLNLLARDQKPSNVGASSSGQNPQTNFRPIPRQIFANKAKLNNKYSSNLYKMPDSEFLFKCCQKIRKLMTSKGRIVTASHACQYRLFPPVPLEQRMSSPRTTHPAWAATKFFEKLESLGLGCLLVFRGQSIKFQKNKLEDMTDEARQILVKIRLSEQDYVDSFTTTGRQPAFSFDPHIQGDPAKDV
ncbi:uncharacterized protein LOC132545049 [Ylistrum balloti]|uniref:uncharacterized protein LOC132545049 n=1 Tax=Ylistrum balloti TaxID=509963 RepID=UPI002905B53C|nr:uncharacterized protein LOC132545049 [Ylistrum balloti]